MNENLADLYAYVLPIHAGLMHMLLTLVVIYLLLTQIAVNSKNYVLRIRYFLPIYHGVLSVVVFTGILLLTTLNFSFSFGILRMILAFIVLVGLSVVGFKRLKRYAPTKELDKFKKFALLQSILEIAAILFAGIR